MGKTDIEKAAEEAKKAGQDPEHELNPDAYKAPEEEGPKKEEADGDN
jgi:hypothetical protein